MQYLFAALFAASSLLPGADALPLAVGNELTLKSASGQLLQVRVDRILLLKDNETYLPITGYRAQNAWLRRDTNGELQWLNLDTDVPELITRFDPERGTYTTNLEACAQHAAVDRKRTTWRQFDALRIEYSGGCPDNAISEELYVENLALVRRVVSTFAGPVTYDLVTAKIWSLIYGEQAGTLFDVALPSGTLKSNEGVVRTRVTLRLTTRNTEPIRLFYSDGQQYEFRLINPAGEVVWLWSKDLVFTAAASEELVLDRRWEQDLVIKSVAPGLYLLEGSLTHAGPHRFATSTTVRID